MAGTEEVISASVAPRISILIPTFRRPLLLPKALASLALQQNCNPGDFEIVVVDNCPDASARPIFDQAAEAHGTSLRMRFLHEPRPGISHARNTALAAARSDHVLFLDDDQQASPRLVAHYLRAMAMTNAAILIGPVVAVFEGGGGAETDADLQAYFSRSYAVADLADITNDIAPLGTNNSLFNRTVCFPEAAPFEPALGLLGGEDTLVFRRMRQRGLRFVWVADALACESVPLQRQNHAYIRMRRFRSGQIRVLTCLRLSPPRLGDAALWMAVGAMQAALYLLAAMGLRLVGNPRWQHMIGRAYGGAGKFLWMQWFQFPAYGANARLSQ